MEKTLLMLLQWSESSDRSLIQRSTLPFPEIKKLEQMGYLFRAADLTEVESDCGEHDVADVVQIDCPGGKTTYIKRCPCGFEPIEYEDIQCWRIRFDLLLKSFAQAMDAVPEPDIPDISWNFGRHKRKNFVFLKNGGIRYEHIIRERYADSPETLFLVANKALATISRCNIKQTIITFDEIFDFPADYQIVLNNCRLEEILSDRTDWKPEQRRKRGTRLDNIEKATETLRVYAKSLLEAMDAGGMSFEFPERPSQIWLAEKLNTNQSNVSRCLQDKNAVQLRFIWEALLSPDKLENLRPYLYKQF